MVHSLFGGKWTFTGREFYEEREFGGPHLESKDKSNEEWGMIWSSSIEICLQWLGGFNMTKLTVEWPSAYARRTRLWQFLRRSDRGWRWGTGPMQRRRWSFHRSLRLSSGTLRWVLLRKVWVRLCLKEWISHPFWRQAALWLEMSVKWRSKIPASRHLQSY